MKKIVNKRVCVVVLGDIGRSPRMQYHVKSLLNENFFVDVIGYSDSKPLPELIENSNCNIYELRKFPELNLPNSLKYIFKTFWQILTLLTALFSIQTPQTILCQNPPAIPTLFVCYFYCFVMRSKFIIDWHNYAYSIMALELPPTSITVKIAKLLEQFYGRRSHANLCVTEAMKKDLAENWGIKAVVLYDRPPVQFQPISLEKKHELFMKLSQDHSQFLPKNLDDFKERGVLESTAFTQKHNTGIISIKKKRPGLLISSTSWTADEDFNILLEALDNYEKSANEEQKYVSLICVITGKGPLKSDYQKKIFERKWNHIMVVTPWIEIEDYPLLLASSDLGVCLHMSSSGLDLPMKVVDMFGCGLPVCAINFKSLHELVHHQKNGFVFETSKELSDILLNWFENHPDNNMSIVNIKTIFEKNLKEFQSVRWTENWNENCLPLFY